MGVIGVADCFSRLPCEQSKPGACRAEHGLQALNDYKAQAADLDDAYLMLAAGEAIREELRQAGHEPR